MAAMFLRHEGFLGAVGAFLKVHPMPFPGAGGTTSSAAGSQPRKVRGRRRWSRGAVQTRHAVGKRRAVLWGSAQVVTGGR